MIMFPVFDLLIAELNVDPDKDSRPTKAKERFTLYRDDKSKPHATIKGKGVVARIKK